MMLKRPIYLFAIVALVVATVAGCGKRKREFTREAWSFGDGLVYPNREVILDDLLAKNKLVGLNHYQVIQLLGTPQDKDTVKFRYSYQIVNDGVDYNPKKNPVYRKDLLLYFSKDSVVTKKEVVEKNQKFK